MPSDIQSAFQSMNYVSFDYCFCKDFIKQRLKTGRDSKLLLIAMCVVFLKCKTCFTLLNKNANRH